MPELLNICLIYSNSWNLPHPTHCINSLFGALPSWFGKPRSAMFLNWATGEEITLPWPVSDQGKFTESGQAIVCVYADSTNYESTSSNSISIQQCEGSAVYTVSAAMTEVLSHPLENIENLITNLFLCLKDFAVPIVAVGSEIDFKPTRNETAAVLDAISEFTNAFWVVAENSLLAQHSFDLHDVRQINGGTLLRRDIVLSLLHNS